jgi:hypothetical protein
MLLFGNVCCVFGVLENSTRRPVAATQNCQTA